MAVGTANELKTVLFEAYDGFADKRLRDMTRDAPFLVDDRGPGDFDARKQLFLWFCQIFLRVEAADRVRLSFRGGLPMSDAVEEWFAKHGGTKTDFGMEVTVTMANIAALGDLADRIRAIIRRPYDTRAYKFVVPRTAASIDQLGGVLRKAWS